MNLPLLRHALLALIVGSLAACATRPTPDTPPAPSVAPPAAVATLPGEPAALPGPLVQPRSHWVPVHWGELPGFAGDALHEAWNAWIKSCERPAAPFAALCAEVRQLSIAGPEEQRAWMVARLQPYRVEAPGGAGEGLLTGYFEPEYEAARQRGNGFEVPLYAPPADLARRRPWYTRQEIDTVPQAQAALAGRAIAWLRDPVDAMVLHIQGSGRLNVLEPDGARRQDEERSVLR